MPPSARKLHSMDQTASCAPFNDEHHVLQTPSREAELLSPSTAEPKSEYLRQKLREARESHGLSDQHLRPLSFSEPKPPLRGLDDYIFEGEEEGRKTRRRSRAQGSRATSSSTQYTGGRSARTPGHSMGVREHNANMDKLNKENFNLKLRLTLVEERSHKLEEELTAALEKIEAFRTVEEQRNDLEEENNMLNSHIHELQQSREACEQKLRDSWKMNGEVFAELEKRDAAIKEALDMYLDSERRMQDLDAELVKYKTGPRRRDSSYFSNEPGSARTHSSEELGGPPPSQNSVQKGGYTSEPLSPERRDVLQDLDSPRPLTINKRYTKLVRTVSVGEMRLKDLRKRVSSASDLAIDDGDSNRSSPEQPRRRLRRTSGSPQLDRASINTSQSGQSRGLRSMYMDPDRETASPAPSESVKAPSDITHFTDLSSSRHLHIPSATSQRAEFGSRAMATPSPLDSYHLSDYEAETESAAESDLPEGSVEDEDEASQDGEVELQQVDGGPTTPTGTDSHSIPTEYQPGQYPKWPAACGKLGYGRDMFFNGELEEVPRANGRK